MDSLLTELSGKLSKYVEMMGKAIKEGKLRIEWKTEHWKSIWVNNIRKDHLGQEFVFYFPFLTVGRGKEDCGR